MSRIRILVIALTVPSLALGCSSEDGTSAGALDAASLADSSDLESDAAVTVDGEATGDDDAGDVRDAASDGTTHAEAGADSGGDAATGTTAAVFTYNICGADSNCKVADPTAAVLANVGKYHPAAFVLQEICQSQADKISAALRAQKLSYVQRFQNAASHLVNTSCGAPEGWGNAVFHVGSSLGDVVESAYASQGNYFTRPQNRAYLCVHVPSPDFWMCTTHIDVEAAQQTAQINELRTVIAGLANRPGKRPVVVGGDFNVAPAATSINGMFAPTYAQGTGIMLERDVALNRTFAPAAATEGGQKIDYLFHTSSVVTTGGAVVPATSDHRLVENTVVIPP